MKIMKTMLKVLGRSISHHRFLYILWIFYAFYLAALEPFPYLMTPTQVAEFACGTPGGARHLLKMGGD